MKDFEAERYREPWESDEHWQLRKEFLEKYSNEFEEDRLLCLAQTYSNIELLKCRYPDIVMRQIRELSKNLSGPLHKLRKKMPIEFKKGGGIDNEEICLGILSAKKPEKIENVSSNLKAGCTQEALFSNSDHSIKKCAGGCPYVVPVSGCLTTEHFIFLKRILEEMNFDKHGSQAISNASNKLNFGLFYKIEMESGCQPHQTSFNCNFYINHFLVGSGKAPSKKKARFESIKIGIENLKNLHDAPNLLKRKPFPADSDSTKSSNKGPKKKKQELHQEQDVHQEQDMLQEQEVHLEQEVRPRTIQLIPGIGDDIVVDVADDTKLESSNKDSLRCKFLAKSFPRRFVLMYHQKSEMEMPLKILLDSAQFSRTKLKFKYEQEVVNMRCSVILDDEVCGTGVHSKMQDAKVAAATDAVEFLKTFIYSIKVKDECEGFVITYNQLGGGASTAEAIPEDSIGGKMMKMMGWSGGSIGRIGSSGIIEPISAEKTQKHREGLGFLSNKEIPKNFRASAKALIQDYAKSDASNDLIFSNEFSKEERKIIHEVAMKYNLKNASRGGYGENRHVVISRKYSAPALLNYLLKVGGSSFKYDLIHPLQHR